MFYKDSTVSFIVVIVLVLILVFYGTVNNRLEQKIETLEETHEEELMALEEERDALSKELESVYESLNKMADYEATLYVYFEEQSISFEEAYEAYDNFSQLFGKFF